MMEKIKKLREVFSNQTGEVIIICPEETFKELEKETTEEIPHSIAGYFAEVSKKRMVGIGLGGVDFYFFSDEDIDPDLFKKSIKDKL